MSLISYGSIIILIPLAEVLEGCHVWLEGGERRGIADTSSAMHYFGVMVIRCCKVEVDSAQSVVQCCHVETFSFRPNKLCATHSIPCNVSTVYSIRSTERCSPRPFRHFHPSAMSLEHALLFSLFIHSINLYEPLLRFFHIDRSPALAYMPMRVPPHSHNN